MDLIKFLDNGCDACEDNRYIFVEDDKSLDEYCMNCGVLKLTLIKQNDKEKESK
tara:strand:- start:1465 stop:1626 length:162 start_codon:yes stop_codon:yes gene_type:complete